MDLFPLVVVAPQAGQEVVVEQMAPGYQVVGTGGVGVILVLYSQLVQLVVQGGVTAHHAGLILTSANEQIINLIVDIGLIHHRSLLKADGGAQDTG